MVMRKVSYLQLFYLLMSSDIASTLQTTIQQAIATRTPLQIVGGQTKAFYGHSVTGQLLEVANHSGILNYEPSELVVTARAGTRLSELTATLATRGQWLAFEPPHFGDQATLGGTIACGFSGPARPYLGAARDFVLGVKCINGRGEILRFGGQVMKNVAGYDLSRLMVGALGTLGVLLEISCKVLPLPAETATIVIPTTLTQALPQLIHWGNQTIPLTASSYEGGRLWLRIAGDSIQSILNKMPGDWFPNGDQFWTDLREQRLPFFTQGDLPLWRLSVPPTAPALELAGEQLIEWGGGLRWLRSDLPATTIRHAVAQVGGHATWFRGEPKDSAIFHPLPAPLAALHDRLRVQFDPQGIFNPPKI